MCDYSAEAIANRAAVVGDNLVVHRITSHTLGLVAREHPAIPVCLCVDTRVLVEVKPLMREQHPNLAALPPVARATFHKREATDKNPFRDGLIFDDLPGVHVSLQHLSYWTEVSVETIPGVSMDESPPVQTREPAFA